MISALFSRLVILVFGTLYPAYSSYKAVKTKDIKLYVKWMMYWIVFALFTAIETFTDIFFSFWFPFYYEFKIGIVIWLLSPMTRGSSIMYRKVIHPLFMRREQEIDDMIAKAKDQGYNVILDIGCRGMTLATSAIMNTAVKNTTSVTQSVFKQPEPKADRTDAPTKMDHEPMKVDPEEHVYVNDTDEEFQTPAKQKTRKSRRRNASASRTRVTRSKKIHVDDDPDWES